MSAIRKVRTPAIVRRVVAATVGASTRSASLAAGGDELARRRESLVRRLRKRLAEDFVYRLRQVRPEGGHERRRFVQMGEHHLQVALAVERRPAGQALEQDAAKGVDVGACVD